YRLAILQDDRVFEKQSAEIQNNLVIDLLLDASSSRMRQQESIAAQAYTIAKSLVTCNIPVQVSAFRSLRGFTAIQILKKYDEQQCEKIFRYFASGFNRDGLALQALDKIIDRDEKKHIIFVLTDASPLDSTKMPPEKGSIFLREYDGIAALEDTKEAVKLLREKGNYVAAIFTGSSTHLANAHRIYGHYFLRIQKVEQLADGLGELLHQALREIFD
ncbi:MAG: hypothetical protein IJ875_03860, partial [Solobacterium sp.]|nr:hypothetical protein [Solobacterium sp.]